MEPDPYIGQTFFFNVKPQVEDAPRGGNGSQVLPVADLSDDFDGNPEDGMEYLFLVRREASKQAKVYRVSRNPYETTEQDTKRVVVPDKVHSSRPLEEWRRAFVEKFTLTRTRMALPPESDALSTVDPTSIPAPRQESAWRILVNGKRSKPAKPPAPRPLPTPTSKVVDPVEGDLGGRDTEMTDLEAAKAAILASLELDTPDSPSAASPPPPPPPPVTTAPMTAPSSTLSPTPQIPEYDKLPQLPTPSLILSIPRTSIIHVLSHFNEWFTERMETYEQELNWVPSTIFAPPALRRKPVGGGTKPNGSGGGVAVKPMVVPAQKKKESLVAPLPSPHEVHWILSLLSRLNDLLDGDDLSNLRLLGKTLVEMIEASEKALVLAMKKDSGEGKTIEERRIRNEEEEARARCWMIVAAIAGVWKQEDLWNVNL